MNRVSILRRIYGRGITENNAQQAINAVVKQTKRIIPMIDLHTNDPNKLDDYILFYIKVMKHMMFLESNVFDEFEADNFIRYYGAYINRVIEAIRTTTMLSHLVSERFDVILGSNTLLKKKLESRFCSVPFASS